MHNSEKHGYAAETKEWFSAILLCKTPNGDGAHSSTFYRSSGEYTLKNGVDYTVSYENNKEIGTATATITGKGLYKGTVTAEFNIVEKLTIDGLRDTYGNPFKASEIFTSKALEITFDSSNAGKFENLYKNCNNKKKFVACAKIDKNGKATLPGVAENADYIVMLCEFSDKPCDMNNDGFANAKDALVLYFR